MNLQIEFPHELIERLDRMERMLQELGNQGPEPDFYSTNEAAKKLGLSQQTLLRKIREKEIVAHAGYGEKPRYKIPRDEVERLLKKQLLKKR